MQEYISNSISDLIERLKRNEELVERYRRENFENEQKLKNTLKLCSKLEYNNELLMETIKELEQNLNDAKKVISELQEKCNE